MQIKYNDKKFSLSKFKNEAELEKVVVDLADDIFGNNSIYIDTKRKIKRKKV